MVPAARLVGQRFRAEDCAAVAVAAVTDGQLGDDPAQLRDELAAAGLTRALVLVPDGTGRLATLGAPALGGVVVHGFDTHGGDALAVAYGKLVAALTGQRLTDRQGRQRPAAT